MNQITYWDHDICAVGGKPDAIAVRLSCWWLYDLLSDRNTFGR